jgi:hypothetical protein
MSQGQGSGYWTIHPPPPSVAEPESEAGEGKGEEIWKGKGKGMQKGKGKCKGKTRDLMDGDPWTLYDEEWDVEHGGYGCDQVFYTRSQWLAWYYDAGPSYAACHVCYLEQQVELLKIELHEIRRAFLMVRDGWCESRSVMEGVFRE